MNDSKSDLKEKLWDELKRIKEGEVKTYKEIAEKLKSHPRVIAKVISKNKKPIEIPCHRVIRSDGKIGGYTYNGKLNPKKKEELLKKEGVKIVRGKVVFERGKK